jgi:hypothetical protein
MSLGLLAEHLVENGCRVMLYGEMLEFHEAASSA